MATATAADTAIAIMTPRDNPVLAPTLLVKSSAVLDRSRDELGSATVAAALLARITCRRRSPAGNADADADPEVAVAVVVDRRGVWRIAAVVDVGAVAASSRTTARQSMWIADVIVRW